MDARDHLRAIDSLHAAEGLTVVAYTNFLTYLQSTGLAHAISKGNHMIGASLQVFHILGFVLLLSSLIVISLRILGLAFTQAPLPRVARDGVRLIWLGLAVAIASGTLMFISGAWHYGHNWAFELKMVLLISAVAVQALLVRHVTATETPSLAVARASVGLSLLLWFGVGLCGRMIGFI
jgi:hypothetical protein